MAKCAVIETELLEKSFFCKAAVLPRGGFDRASMEYKRSEILTYKHEIPSFDVYKSIRRNVTLEQLLDKVEAAGGIVTSTELKCAGISPGLISYAYKKGVIGKLTRGVYCSLDVFEDDFSSIGFRWRKCVFSHASSLYLLGLSDRLPATLDVAVPYGYNPTSLKSEFPNVCIHHVKPELYSVGVIQVQTPAGNSVNCYDAERSIADLIKERRQGGSDAQLVRNALTGYFGRKDRDLPRLSQLCEALGVRDELQVYLEVL